MTPGPELHSSFPSKPAENECMFCFTPAPGLAFKYPVWNAKEKFFRLELKKLCPLCIPRVKMACEKLLKALKEVGA